MRELAFQNGWKGGGVYFGLVDIPDPEGDASVTLIAGCCGLFNQIP